MYAADKRLVACKSECHICREIIVWFACPLTKRVTIYERHVQIRIPFATYKRVVVGNISCTGRDIHIYWNTVVVVIFIVFMPYPPCISTNDTVESLDRTNHTGKEFTPKARTATLTVIEDKVGDTICNLSDTHSSHGGGNKVVYCRRFYLAGCFPHQRTAERIGN